MEKSRASLRDPVSLLRGAKADDFRSRAKARCDPGTNHKMRDQKYLTFEMSYASAEGGGTQKIVSEYPAEPGHALRVLIKVLKNKSY